jgi:alkanesulfonate monooxygenase SsuD/methylene tetrahydromethanopterin reductase-like flavin-dependent oxidoreductase (luciferase family)
VAVVILPLRNPVIFAKQTAVLDNLSGGRLLVGVAPGAKLTEKEFQSVGVDFHKRGRICDDYIKAVRTIWTQPLATYRGKYLSFAEVQVFPKPIQKPHPPILIGGGEGGLSDIAMRRVLELGNGWIPAYLTADEAAEGIRRLREGSKKVGRGDEKFIVGLEMFTGIRSSDSEARDAYAATLSKNFVSVEEGMKRSLVGSTRSLSTKLEGYEKAGLDYVELKMMYSTVREFHETMDKFADILTSYQK